MSVFVITSQQLTVGEEITVESDCQHVIEYFRDKESIGIDTETTGFDNFNGKLLTLQLGNQEHQWVIDATTIDVLSVKELMESKLTLYHNFAFDGKWLKSYGIEPKNIYDSFLAECLFATRFTTKEGNLGLEDVARKYLNVEISKEIRGRIHKVGLTDEVIKYAAKDVQYLHAIREKQLVEITTWNLQEVLRLENEVTRPFMLMMFNGMLIDSKKWLEVADYVEDELKKISAELDDILIKESSKYPALDKLINKQLNLFDFEEKKTLMNWKSPDQKKKLLNSIGINVDGVNDKVLQKHKKHAIVKELITFSKHSKFADTFGKEFVKNINKNTGRIHSSVWQVLSTGRISISDPPLQQIPAHGELAKKIKECFIARDGYTLVDTDVSGFEIVIATQFSKEPAWIEILNNHGDIHSETAVLMFGITKEQVNDPFPERPNYSYRFISKSCSFLAMYGGNEFTLADRIQVTKEKAKLLLQKYFSAVPKLKQFLDMLAASAVAHGRIRSDPYYKRIRWFPNLKEDDWKSIGETQREAMNLPMQSQNANLIKECIINLQKEIDEKHYNVKLLLQIHDAILSEAEDNIAQLWKETQERIMIETISKHITLVPVKVSTTMGKHWNH